jgi:ankyrin repeat protein
MDQQDRLERFLEAAIEDHRVKPPHPFETARAIRRLMPDIGRLNFAAAVVLGEETSVRDQLRLKPELATRPQGNAGITPILWLCFSRFLRSATRHEDTSGFLGTARCLLDHGANPDDWYAVNDDPNARQTCLYGAAGIANNPELTALLLKAGADPNDQAPGLGPESLYHAAEFRDSECLRLILEKKPHADKVSYCLGRCLDFENPGSVELFLRHGADPDFSPKGFGNGETRLHHAVRNGRSARIIRLLLEHGADCSRTDNHGLSPYRLAVRMGRQDLVDEMENFSPSSKAHTLPEVDHVLGACMAGNVEKASSHIKASPGMLSNLNPHDASAVAMAAMTGNTEAVRNLVEAGFPVNRAGSEGMTAAHWAAWRGIPAMLRILIEAGADLEKTNDYGGTVLSCAIYATVHSPFRDGDFIKVIRILLDAGAIVEGIMSFPTGVAEVDALLAPGMQDGTEGMSSGARQVAVVREAWHRGSRTLPDSPTLGDILVMWERELIAGIRQTSESEWTKVILSNHLPEAVQASRMELLYPEAVARYFGFASRKAAEEFLSDRPHKDFEAAVDAVVSGDAEQLEKWLRLNPELSSMKSRFGHRGTLLHYLAANGTEIHRQMVPPRAVETARAILEAGGDPDAESAIYGGGSTSTPLCLLITSTHVVESGLMAPLTRLLLEKGANPDGSRDDGVPLRMAVQYGNDVAVRILLDFQAMAPDLPTAAGAGAMEQLNRFLAEGSDEKSLANGLNLAARHGHLPAVRRLIESGTDPNARGFMGAPALHWAARNGHESVVRFLLSHGADPLLRDRINNTTAAEWAGDGGQATIARILKDTDSLH